MDAEIAYVFRHALVREAAYELQPPGDRAVLHALVIEIVEAALASDDPLLDAWALELADHARAAQAFRRTANLALLKALADKEVGYLARAQKHALAEYDNGVAVGFSRAVAYTIDPGAMTAGQDWEWIDPDWSPPLFGGYVGGVDALANGNVLIEHAGLGGFILDPFHSTWIHLSEVDPNEGEKVFEATIHGSVGYMGYRVRHMESLYPPSP